MKSVAEVTPFAGRILAVDLGNKGGYCYNDKASLFIEGCSSNDAAHMVGRNLDPTLIVAEDVNSYSPHGGKLMFQKGILVGVSMATATPIELISPLEWISCFTLKRRKHFESDLKWKKHLVEIANRIAPNRKFNLQTADAFLIWYWAASKVTGFSLTKL